MNHKISPIRTFVLAERSNLTTVLTASLLGCLLIGAYIFIGIDTLPSRWWLLIVLIPLIITGFLYRTIISHTAHAWWMILVLASIAMYGGNVLYKMYKLNLDDPPVFDFHAFWLWGKVSAEGLNFYDSESIGRIADQYLEPDSAFVEVIIDTGFLYPPPSIFLFTPLGWFDIQTAMLIWNTIQLAFVIFSIYLLWDLFLRQCNWNGLLLVFVMVITLYSTYLTLNFAQFNFMMLAISLLIVRERNRILAGVWIAFGIVIKPVIAVYLLYFLIKRQWKTVAITAATLAGFGGITILVYGADNFLPYFFDNPVSKQPKWLYFDDIYQSLLAKTIRITNFDLSTGMPFMQPIFYIPAIILIVFTIIFLYITRDDKLQLSLFALITTTALLLYPHTQIHYGILLLLPILIVIVERSLFGIWSTIGLLTLIYVLSSYAYGAYSFYVFVFVWLVFAFIVARQVNRQWHLPEPGTAIS